MPSTLEISVSSSNLEVVASYQILLCPPSRVDTNRSLRKPIMVQQRGGRVNHEFTATKAWLPREDWEETDDYGDHNRGHLKSFQQTNMVVCVSFLCDITVVMIPYKPPLNDNMLIDASRPSELLAATSQALPQIQPSRFASYIAMPCHHAYPAIVVTNLHPHQDFQSHTSLLCHQSPQALHTKTPHTITITSTRPIILLLPPPTLFPSLATCHPEILDPFPLNAPRFPKQLDQSSPLPGN